MPVTDKTSTLQRRRQPLRLQSTVTKSDITVPWCRDLLLGVIWKKTIINPPSTFLPYLHSRSLAVSHHRFLPPSLPPSLPPLLPPSLPPSILPRPFPVSHHRFLPPSRPLPPPSLPPSILPLSFPAPRCPPASCRATQYTLYSVGELHWVLCREGPARRRYAARRGTETMEWSRHQQVARCYLGNAPPRRIRF